MELLVLLLSAMVTTQISLPLVEKMLIEGKMLGKNYLGHLIPVGMGAIIIPIIILNQIILIGIFRRLEPLSSIFLIGVIITSFVGAVDDMLGNRDTLGFRGHLNALRKGHLTTGGFKLVVGGMVSFYISQILSGNIIELLINLLVLGLMTNFLNLMDLRPGRALKVFMLLGISLFFLGAPKVVQGLLIPLLGFGLIYLPFDLKAKGMLGDVGSNPLGMALGIGIVYSYSLVTKLIILIMLILIHVITEKYSLTELIKKNRILNYLDQLGRG